MRRRQHALWAVVVLAAVGVAPGCASSGERSKRGATNQARDLQEAFVELLQTETREVSGQGRELADSVRAAYASDAWFGESSEEEGRGVLMAYFDGRSEVGGGLDYSQTNARLCVRLEVALGGDRLLVLDSFDIPCPQELLDSEGAGRNRPDAFQQFDEDGEAEWVTLEELSRPGR